jgi:hypothetical protein
MTQIAKGWLGSKVAIMFPKFFANEFSRMKPDDVLDNFEKIKHQVEAAASDIEAVASISRSVISTIKKRTAANMKTKQRENIKAFMQVLPKDVASQFWLDLLNIQKMKKVALEWQSDKGFSTFLRTVYCK